MKKILIIILLCAVNSKVNAELLKPSPILKPSEIIMIQLKALNNNDYPIKDFGILQTWEFAHPNNKKYTGPLENFKKMMYSSSYESMINHQKHIINEIQFSENMALFFVEIIDKNGSRFGFTWMVEKVLDKGDFYDCWMTTSVSAPMKYGEST